ncbi:uncharacterized protein LOC120850764 [Ixodes scapularis]|uniref:uncharacterized protein LOC120850764 n=1 Tax=Ixodes scapularis TaxID=6945 RepID=UPI001C389B69|nr:uncharacterized protein LOC120850764 [Ixodes scapularis]
MGQEDGHRRVLLGCRSPSFSITVCPAQGKFKNWARRITLVPDSTLMLGNRLVVPRDRYADIAWTFHIADPQRHLTISEVVLRIQTVYTWGRQNFGMCWEVAAYVCGTCDRPACRSRSAHLGAAAYLNFDNCGGRVSGVQFPPPWLRDSVTALAWAVQNRVRLNPLATSVELRLKALGLKMLYSSNDSKPPTCESHTENVYEELTFACLAVGAFAGDRFNNPGFRGFGSGLGFGGARLLGSAASIDPVYPPQPYNFGYDTADEYGTKQFHKEQGDASNTKTGTYGYSDANGLFRRVNYVADAGGFRATVETNEPGTEAGQSADAVFNANPVVTGPTAAAAYAVPAYARYGGFGGHH